MTTRKIFLSLVAFTFFIGFSSIDIIEADDLADLCQPEVSRSTRNDVSPELRSIPPKPPSGEGVREVPIMPLPRKFQDIQDSGDQAIDPVVQDWDGTSNMPAPIQNFEGVSNADNIAVTGFSVVPPDTEGDVGPNHYVQWNNITFAIWDKASSKLYGPAAGNTLWSGFGGPCETTNDGDPIVLYDHLADRWLMSQFALPNFPFGPFYQCIAISQTPDPLGAWHRYEFKISNTKMNDYPKFGVWPDGYYLAVNMFNQGSLSWGGQGVAVFERDEMLKGQSARKVSFDLFSVNPHYRGMLPSDLDGLRSPPVGSPNYFVSVDDNAWGWPTDRLQIFEFTVDWSNPAASTFTGPTVLDTAAFDSNMCGYSGNCIPQPGTAQKVDAISDRLMYRLQYRNFGTHETLVVNHTVDVGGDHAGIRWYEVRDPGGTPFIFQQGTYAPDSHHRWMGSIAMDGNGNMALGYSSSSTTRHPSIGYVGRLASDPLGSLPQGETALILGSGSQTGANRWGDYSTMSVDPADSCTFWYTQEYYETSSSRGWQTRIGSFKFPSCAVAYPVADVTANGSDGPVDISAADTLSIEVELASGDFGGDNADWWVVVNTPFGWYHYDLGSDSWVPGLAVTHQGSLFDLNPREVLNRRLPTGTYTFHFGVDMNMDGAVDRGVLLSDKVVVNVAP